MMKKILTLLTIATTCMVSCVEENLDKDAAGRVSRPKMVGDLTGEKEDGKLLIRLTGSAAGAMSEGTFDVAGLLEGLEEASIAPVFPTATEKAAIRHGLHKWYAVSFDSRTSVECAAEILASRHEIEAIQYNSITYTDFSPESIGCTPSPMTRSTGSSSSLPFNDMLLNKQWNLINDGTTVTGSVAGSDVGVKDAWKLTTGDPRVVVAVFDQGIAYGHPDLKKAMWKNTKETGGRTGVDDDKNGYVDDKYGYNFVSDSGELTFRASTGDHGTHIAGTIAATNNNKIGVSSIAGGSGKGDGVRLMSCQICAPDGSFTSVENKARAFKYAADNGACIAQCSYGSTSNTASVEKDALNYFLDPENANCSALETNIAIVSAGNYNTESSLNPGTMKDCIAVTAICHDFLPGGYSNYGAGCDIAAPGGDLVRGESQAPCMILSTGLDNSTGEEEMTYVYKYGTSMACPHVVGVAALGLSYALKIGKRFTREEFISRLLTSAKDIDSYQKGSTMKLWVETKYSPLTGQTQSTKETDVFLKKGKMGTGAVDAWSFLMALEGTALFITTPGKSLTIDLAQIIGDSYGKYTIEMEPEDMESLGISSLPSADGSVIELTCTKTGAGKIRFKSSVGAGKDNVPVLEYYKEISVVSRASVAENGGWL